MRARLSAIVLLAVLGLGGVSWAVFSIAGAQDADDKSAFIRYVEEQISSDEMQIRLGAIDGALNSDVTISQITIADADGIWLTLEGVHLIWSRVALLSGTLDVDRLEAERIVLTRAGSGGAGAGGEDFQIPEISADILIDQLSVPRVEIGPAVFGMEAVLGVDGGLTLQGGSLATRLEIERLDRPGRLSLEAAFDNASRQLDVKFGLNEPKGGVIASALGIRGDPAVDFTIEGSGPLDAFTAEMRLAANGETLFGGPAAISEADGGYRLRADLTGGFEKLIDPAFAPYFGADAALAIDAALGEDGTIALNSLLLRSGLAVLEANGAFAGDGVPTRLRLEAKLGGAGDLSVPLPGTGGATVTRGAITATLGEASDGGWSARADLEGLSAGALDMAHAEITANGIAENMADALNRHVTFGISGNATGLGSDDPAIAGALGERIALAARGQWRSGQPISVAAAEVTAEAARVGFAGKITADAFDGDWSLASSDLAAFAGIAGRDLGGGAEIRATGPVARRRGGFDLTIDGTARDLALGEPEIDGLLAGATTLLGGARREGREVSFARLTLTNERLQAVIDGGLDESAANLQIAGRIDDVSAVTAKAAGAVVFNAALAGPEPDRTITGVLRGENLRLMDRPFTDAVLSLDGHLRGDDLTAGLTLAGALGGVPLTASAGIERTAEGARRVRALDVSAGQARASGDIAIAADGAMDGRIRIDAPQVSVLAPLLLADASGALEADVTLSAGADGQDASVVARATGLHFNDMAVDEAAVDLVAKAIFTAPSIDGSIKARRIVYGELRIDELAATAAQDGGDTRFRANAVLERGTLAAAGTIRPREDGFDLALGELNLVSELGDASLAAPATVSIRGADVTFDAVDFRVAGGRVELSGGLGERVDLRAALSAVPLAIANAMAPFLEASGTVSGVVTATGSLDQPRGSFDLKGEGIGAKPLRELGVDRLDITAGGTFDAGTVDFTARTSIAGGAVDMRGKVGRTLDLTADFRGLPLAVANTLAPDLDLSGTVTGSVTATGSLDRPAARFTLKGSGVGARPLRDVGIDGLGLSASGTYAGKRIELASADFTGAGLNASARGTIPLEGRGLDLAVTGQLPLSLTDHLLIDRGARLDGVVQAQLRARGSLADPAISGTISGSGIVAADPGTGLSVRDISVEASLDGERVTISRLAGALGGGTIGVTGTAVISKGLGYPLDLAIALRRARYEDGRLVVATLDGDLTLRGRLEGEVVLGGTVIVDRAEISVPESLPASASMLDVQHRGAPPAVIATLRRAGVGVTGGKARDGGASTLRLDITIVAPSRVFVRGRGLDTELGGEVRLTGPVTAIRPVGSLRMRTGRLDILGKRINFDRGTLTLVGERDPTLDFIATTRGDTVSVTVTVTGRASEPEILFSSVPDLPQDEVLSQLLFGRGIDQLSPLQIAQLGVAAAQLAGAGGGPGILDQLRAGTGLDNLDVTSDAEGNIAVEAGRYVSENVYLGVKGSEESSGVTINLDIAGGFTARAEAGQKDSSVGIFYEVEY